MGKIVTKPSRGPWKELDHHGLPEISGSACCVVSGRKAMESSGYTVVAMMKPDNSKCRGVKTDQSMYPDHHTMWANRRLVCAAPDLLAAVKALMVAVAGEPGALGADARKAVARGSKAVKKALEGDDPADAGALAILHADELVEALEQILASVTGGCDEDDAEAIEETCRAALARVTNVEPDKVTTPLVEEIKAAAGEDDDIDPSDKSEFTYDFDLDPKNNVAEGDA